MTYAEDIARAGYILENFDFAFLSTKTAKGFRTTNNERAPIVVYAKKVDGVYRATAAVSDAETDLTHLIGTYLGSSKEALEIKIAASA